MNIEHSTTFHCYKANKADIQQHNWTLHAGGQPEMLYLACDSILLIYWRLRMSPKQGNSLQYRAHCPAHKASFWIDQ